MTAVHSRFQVIVDTAVDASTPEGTDRLMQRIAWHLRNGVPGLVVEPEGGRASINEIAGDDDIPAGMSEVRRHFRFKVPGTDDWQYHRSYRVAQQRGGTNIQFQRTYKSDWTDLE